MTLAFFLNYLMHLGTALALLGAFMVAYQRITPYPEIALVRSGNLAAALSYSGAVLGFSLTLVSAIFQATEWMLFVAWSVAAGTVQVATFFALSAVFKQVRKHVEEGNVAMGALLGCVSLATGALNAASLS
jgi:putative membrane protein